MHHASQLHDGLQASLHHINQHTIYSEFAFNRLHREVIVQSPTSTATKLTWRDSAARFRAEKNQPLTRYDTVARVLYDDARLHPYNHLLSNQAQIAF